MGSTDQLCIVKKGFICCLYPESVLNLLFFNLIESPLVPVLEKEQLEGPSDSELGHIHLALPYSLYDPFASFIVDRIVFRQHSLSRETHCSGTHAD